VAAIARPIEELGDSRPETRGMRALTYGLALLVTPVLHGLSFPPWSLW
jgi:hypothetical protein